MFNLQSLWFSCPRTIPGHWSAIRYRNDIQSAHRKTFDSGLQINEWANFKNLFKNFKVTILPGPNPLTVTRTVLNPRSTAFCEIQELNFIQHYHLKDNITPAIVIAVACAAIFVPFLVFLKPSMPQDRMILGLPLPSHTVMIVLFGETRILQMGVSLKGTPSNKRFGVSSSGKRLGLKFFFLG